jgi:hypothetical protein
MGLCIAALMGLSGLALGGETPSYLSSPRRATAPPAVVENATPQTTNPITAGLNEAGAIEAWFEWAALNGSDLSVLFGVPAPADAAAVDLAAKSILRLVSSATKHLEAGIAAHDKAQAEGAAGTGATGNPTSDEEATRAVHARTVLLPLRAARAMLLTAVLEPNTIKRAAIAVSASKIAGAAEPVSPWADAERSLLLGVAGLLEAVERPEAARAALDHIAAARKTITEPDAPRGLELELGDEVALASVMGVAMAQPSADAFKVLDRVLEQPAMMASAQARIIAAELRLRIMSPQGIKSGVLSAAAPEAAFAGFVGEYDRAERDGRDPVPVLQRLMVVSRDAVGGAGTFGDSKSAEVGGPTSVARSGVPSASVVQLLATMERVLIEPTEQSVNAAADAIRAMPESSPWRRIGPLVMLSASPGTGRTGIEHAPTAPDATAARLALARAAVELVDSVPIGEDQSRLLTRATEMLAPLGPTADLDLSEKVFTLAAEHGTHPRVTAGRSQWGLKEVFEARAERSLASRDPAGASDWLKRAGELTAPGVRPCAECWWSVMDALLRDADAVESRVALIEEVVGRTERAVSAWIALDGKPATDPITPPRADPDMGLILNDIEKRMRPIAVDVRTWRRLHGGTKPAQPTPVEALPPDAAVLLESASASETGAADRLRSALERIEPSQRVAWTARLIDRAWAQLRRHTRGFIAAPSDEPARNAAAVLALMSSYADNLPETASGGARERCAWGLLLFGDAKAAAAMFGRCIAASGKRVDLMRGLGESHIAAGDDAAAFGVFRDISSATAPEGENARDHFHAWARMLEVLARQNADGSKSALIARESRRLMLLNPAATCPECAERIKNASDAAEHAGKK